MDDLPRQKLRAILSTQGRAVCNNGQRMNELLASVCPEHPREVEVLSQALDELLADEALDTLGERPWNAIANQLVTELVDRHSMKEEDAQWAATSWGVALGELSPDQPGSQLPPLPTNGWETKASELGALTQPGSPSLNQPGAPALGQLDPSAFGQPDSLTPPEHPFAKTPQLPGAQVKRMVLMVFAIIAGLIAASMTFRIVETARKESLYRNQPASYWSQKLQEPIQRKEVWQGHLKMLKDIDPAADLRRGDPEAIPVLIELLKEENSVVRQEAILILARIGGPAKSAMPALQQALNDPDEQVRARATTALKQIELAVETQAGPR
jgi:hypothetical protein